MHSYAVNNAANLAACSNNSINENRYNSEKLAKSSAVYRLKKILKPLVTLLKSKSKTQSVKSTSAQVDQRRSIISYIDDFDCDYDNSANERLEAALVAELEQCHATDAAILVLEDQQLRLQPVLPEELYVPVHFARTEAGTFFWTAMPAREVDEDLIQPAHCYSEEKQYAQQAYADRWAQA
uniref:Enhancer of split malpha protein n=1 Tax=Anopheles christyi TaxID=43041 RepID=A0A182K333_9DIPT